MYIFFLIFTTIGQTNFGVCNLPDGYDENVEPPLCESSSNSVWTYYFGGTNEGIVIIQLNTFAAIICHNDELSSSLT
jgi:hypothetical protein